MEEIANTKQLAGKQTFITHVSIDIDVLDVARVGIVKNE